MSREVTIATDHYFNSAAERVAEQASVGAGETATERDTGNVYVRTTSGWLLTRTAGDEHVRTTASEVPFPNEAPLYFTGTAASTADNAAVYVSGDVSIYNHHEFSIVTAPGASAVEVHICHDGVTFEATAVQLVDRSLVVGAVVQGLAQLTAIGNYYIDGVFSKFRILNNGVTAAQTVVRGSHSVT